MAGIMKTLLSTIIFLVLFTHAMGQDDPYIELTWVDRSDNEQGFIIERSLSEFIGFKEIDRTLKDVETYRDYSIELEIIYYYRVKAFNRKGMSSPSNTDNAIKFNSKYDTSINAHPQELEAKAKPEE